MHSTTPPIFPAPAASSTRRTAAGVKADRRSPAGLGLDPGEDRRTLATAGTVKTQNTSTKITCIMPMSGRAHKVTSTFGSLRLKRLRLAPIPPRHERKRPASGRTPTAAPSTLAQPVVVRHDPMRRQRQQGHPHSTRTRCPVIARPAQLSRLRTPPPVTGVRRRAQEWGSRARRAKSPPHHPTSRTCCRGSRLGAPWCSSPLEPLRVPHADT
jgi:hypothetical protein